jgi:hypothetical protein
MHGRRCFFYFGLSQIYSNPARGESKELFVLSVVLSVNVIRYALGINRNVLFTCLMIRTSVHCTHVNFNPVGMDAMVSMTPRAGECHTHVTCHGS